LLENYADNTTKEEDLLAIRDYYYKNQYLKRLEQNMNSIGE